jgi:tripartite ATP-independent transporter DctM subunit
MLIAALGFAVMLALIFLRVPIAFAMLITGIAGFAVVSGFEPSLISAARTMANTTKDYSLSIVPLFLLMGNIIARAGISEDLYAACNAWTGHRRGGLARATILSSAAFSAVCGSSLATTATMTKVALPSMRRFGYADSLAAGSIAAGGTLGILIPPSVIMVLYGIMTNTDIGKLFVAGILPGLLAVFLYLASIEVVTRLRPGAAPAGARSSWRRRLLALGKVWEVAGLFLLIIGGIYAGIFTPTEAAGVGAAGAFLAAWFRGRMRWAETISVLFETARMTAGIFLILIGALVFSNFLNMTPMPKALVELVSDKSLSAPLFICVVVVIYLLLGCVLDSISMILLTVPLFFPLVKELGFDPIWFGIIIVVVTEISLITPPIGMNIFVLNSVAPDLSITTIYGGLAAFVVADLVRVVLLVFVPQISLFLPSLM